MDSDPEQPQINLYKLCNYPNPFNPTTTINYDLPAEGLVTLKIFNTLGELVNTVVNEFQSAGYRSATWNGKDFSGNKVTPGVYLIWTASNTEKGRKVGKVVILN